MANGFSYTSSHEWANLGQGAPEVGPLPDAPPRPDSIPMPLDSLEYAPTTGVKGSFIANNSLQISYAPYVQPSARPLQTCTMSHTVKINPASIPMKMFALFQEDVQAFPG
jgi:hypothetical protein